MRTFSLWASGILASGIFGGLIGSVSNAPDGGSLGILGGIFAFVCARLWLAAPR